MRVTPGHAFFTPSGDFAKIGDVLLNDGFIVHETRGIVRARTNEEVSEEDWKLYNAFGVRLAAPDGGWAAWSAEQGYTADGVARAYAEAARLPLPDETREMAFAGGAAEIDGEFPFGAADGYVLPYAGREPRRGPWSQGRGNKLGAAGYLHFYGGEAILSRTYFPGLRPGEPERRADGVFRSTGPPGRGPGE